MANTAFLVLRSPQELDPTHTITRFADKEHSSVVLVEDGVYQAVLQKSSDKLANAAREILVSAEDMGARGFGASDLRIGRAVGYPEIIECIMERTERTVTV